MRLESLEDRRLLAADFFVNDNWDTLADVGAPGLSVGDTVINNNDTTNPGGTVATYGVDGFGTVTTGSSAGSLVGADDINDAIAAAVAGDTVNVLEGAYTENVAINKDLTLQSIGGRSVTTITGVSAVGSLGTIVVTNNTTGVQIGGVGQGFTIVGIDNGFPGVENAAVYFQGSHSGAQILDNEIVANGEAGLLTEYGATIDGFVIDGNEFSGQTFLGSQPAGIGFGSQFSTPNVPRQLVTMGNGGGTLGTALTTNITFTNNDITGSAGGISSDDNVSEQGNTLVTLDAASSTISGNTFAGTTTRFGAALRVRRPGTSITGNTFDSTNMGLGTEHMFLQNNTTSMQDIVAANTFDRGAFVDNGSDLSVSIAGGVGRASTGDTVNVLPGTYVENVVLNKQVELRGAQAGVDARGRVVGAPDPLVESIIAPASGRAIQLVGGSAGAIIDGFSIIGVTKGIESTSGPIDDLQILNNHIAGFTSSGVFLNDSGTDITIHQNVIDGSSQIGGGGIMHLDQDNFDGFHFTSNHVLNGDTGFFVDGSRNVGVSGARSPLFEDNLFDGNGAGANFGRFAVEFATVRENTFSNNSLDGLQGGIADSLIIANMFTGNDRAGMRLTGFGGTSIPIRGAQRNTITQNVFASNGAGMSAFGHGDVRLDNQFDGTISTNVFFENSFGSTVAVFNNESSGETVDFSGNWWGTNSEAGVLTKLAGVGAAAIDFTPFLDNGADTDLGTPGFQGDFSVLNVSTLGAQATGGRIQEGIDLVDVGGTVNVLAGTYDEGPQIVIAKDVNIVGEDLATTIVRPTADTGSSGNSRGWFLVNSGVTVDVSNMTFDGNGFRVWQAFRHLGSGTFDNVAFNDIQFNPSTDYAGTAIAAFGASSNVDVTNSFFSDIGRIGVQYFGPGTTGTFSGNSYLGKGVGDHLDYAVEAGAGAVVEIFDNTISGNRGVASSDGSTSAGILVTTFFGPGTAVDVHDNVITDNTTGVFVGFDSSDTSEATIRDNAITGNDNGVIVVAATALLEGNDLNSNADNGLLVSGGAIVDAGQAAGGATDYTGLGISLGGNDFSSYTPAGTAFAIRNENTNPPNDDPGAQGFPFDLSAQNNLFFSAVAADIEQVVYHDADDPMLGFVIYGQTYVMDGMLIVTGTDLDDKIEIKLGSAKNPGKYEVKIKNDSGSFSFKVEDGEEITKVVVYGLDGNDEIKVDTRGRDVPNWLFGGDGDDKLESGAGDDYLDGGSGNDELKAGEGDNTLLGGAGNDKLESKSGNDYLDGGTGDDELKSGDGDDQLYGREGNDKLESKKGDDLLDGGAGDDQLKSGEGDDKLIGGDGKDKLEGEKGNDILLGGADDDELKGGEDDDLLIGGLGTDKLDGEKGDDILIGGTTSYDQNCAALDAILAEWTRGDISVAAKVTNLSNGSLPVELNSSTVTDDGNVNRLKGGSGSDWFFAGTNDDLDDFKMDKDFLTNLPPLS